jgi:phytoene dehydrogenase-like protein
LTLAMAAAVTDAGGQVRPGAPVSRVLIESGRAAGVMLASGEQIRGSAVVSGADPKRTLLELVDPAELGPELVWRARNIRARGVTAKVNLALDALPVFEGIDADVATQALSGRIQIGASVDYLERAFDAAKYGGLSMSPFLDITIPTLTDPELAPEGRHVMSVVFQYAPFTLKGTSWPREREALLQIALDTIGRHSPGIQQRVVGAQVLTPADLEARFGLTGGHIYHGDLTLDQFFAARPLIECARYRTPIPGLYLCSAGTHPGVGVSGRSGAHAARAVLADG